MKLITKNGIEYKLPNTLSSFQEEMYIHLINWKWQNITKEAGSVTHKGEQIEYDAILPETELKKHTILYPKIIEHLLNHKVKFNFKMHEYFNHMASSQAANINLFLPILLSENVNEVLKEIKNDFSHLAKRPKNMALDVTKFGQLTGHEIPEICDMINEEIAIGRQDAE